MTFTYHRSYLSCADIKGWFNQAQWLETESAIGTSLYLVILFRAVN